MCPAGALHSAAQKIPSGGPGSLRKAASDVANLSELPPGHVAGLDIPVRQAPLSRRASCTEAVLAAERSRRSSLADDAAFGSQPGWNPLLQDLPGNFLLAAEPATQPSSAGTLRPESLPVNFPSAPSRELSRKGSFESIRAKSLQRDDSSTASVHESPQTSTSTSPLVRHPSAMITFVPSQCT